MTEELVPMFVYGTLRIGEGNYQWAGMDVVDELRNVTVPGDLYYFRQGAAFPVANLDGGGIIKGDVLYYELDSECLQDVVQMEVGAGYELRETTATHPDGTTFFVVAWHYPWELTGPKIDDGDWIRAESERHGKFRVSG